MTSLHFRNAARRLWIGSLSIAGALLIVLAAAAAVWLWFDRESTLDAGERSTRALARVLEEQTARSFEAVGLTLSGLIAALTLNPSLSDHDPAFEGIMRRRLELLPHVRALFIVGPDGFITQDTDYPETPNVSLADRDYFIAHARNPGLSMRIGRPLVSRTPGVGFFVSVSRRIDRPDGSFGGVMVAAVEPLFFERFYRELRIGANDGIGLFRRDGILIARFPHHGELIGHDFSAEPLFRTRLPKASDGTYHTVSFIDQVPRIVSYRSVDGFPLLVAVALAEGDLLAGWWRGVAATGTALGIVAVLTGLLAALWVQRRVERERAAQHQIEVQKLEALGRMTGGIAHDFNNLMTIVANALTLIRRRVEDDGTRGMVDTAMAAVDRGTTLTGQLLAFSRRQELRLASADVNELILNMEALLRNAAGSRVELTLDLGTDLPPCFTDQAQFDAALLNLVVNARDAMPSGGMIRISTSRCDDEDVRHTSTLKPGDYACVTVVDTGEGMPPDVQKRALDPFFTTKADKGTGLGLSQVYGFIRQTGGDIRIESQVGSGTAVHLLLPAARAGSTAAP